MRRAPKPRAGSPFSALSGGSSDTERVQGGRGRQGINCQLHVAPVERLFSTMRKAPGDLLLLLPTAVRVRAAGATHAPSRQLRRAAWRRKAKLGGVWPHMLRHSCGYYALALLCPSEVNS